MSEANMAEGFDGHHLGSSNEASRPDHERSMGFRKSLKPFFHLHRICTGKELIQSI